MTQTWFLTDSAITVISDIYRYTERRWGATQAEHYVSGLVARFDVIATRKTLWRPIPPEFGVIGFFTRYEKHTIFWRQFNDGRIGIAAILHNKMLATERLIAAFGDMPVAD